MNNGGYIMVDCKGLDLSIGTAQEIDGIWSEADRAIKTNKPIVASGALYGTAPVTPVTSFGVSWPAKTLPSLLWVWNNLNAKEDGSGHPLFRLLTNPANAKIPLNERKFGGIFACCVSSTCRLRSLTSM